MTKLIKPFMLDLLSHVVDSGDSERSWCYFSSMDPAGSNRSRLSFKNKEKEVGILAGINLKRYLASTSRDTTPKHAPRMKLLKKTPSKEAEPIELPAPYAPQWDELEIDHDDPEGGGGGGGGGSGPLMVLMDADSEGPTQTRKPGRREAKRARAPPPTTMRPARFLSTSLGTLTRARRPGTVRSKI